MIPIAPWIPTWWFWWYGRLHNGVDDDNNGMVGVTTRVRWIPLVVAQVLGRLRKWHNDDNNGLTGVMTQFVPLTPFAVAVENTVRSDCTNGADRQHA